jgi:hypothetical protein
MATYEVNGYGNIFLVKAESDTKAEQIVHEWASGEGLIRVGVSVTQVNLTAFA